MNPSPVQVIAVTGGKGGVGKTTRRREPRRDARRARQASACCSMATWGSPTSTCSSGLTPRLTLADVLAGNCSLEEIVLDAPQGFKVVPAASGIAQLAELDTLTHLGLVRAFGDLTANLDVMVVDTAPGIAGSVLQFSPGRAAGAGGDLRRTRVAHRCLCADQDPDRATMASANSACS